MIDDSLLVHWNVSYTYPNRVEQRETIFGALKLYAPWHCELFINQNYSSDSSLRGSLMKPSQHPKPVAQVRARWKKLDFCDIVIEPQ